MWLPNQISLHFLFFQCQKTEICKSFSPLQLIVLIVCRTWWCVSCKLSTTMMTITMSNGKSSKNLFKKKIRRNAIKCPSPHRCNRGFKSHFDSVSFGTLTLPPNYRWHCILLQINGFSLATATVADTLVASE